MPDSLAITLAAVFVSVAITAGYATAIALRRYEPGRTRLRALAAPASEETDRVVLTDAPNALATRICRLLPRSAKRMSDMRRRLLAAGYRSHAAPTLFAASQIVVAACGATLGLTLTGSLPVALLAAVGGSLLPDVLLSRRIAQRGRLIRNGLPDLLDLLIVCLDAGSNLDQAMHKAGEELSSGCSPLADELAVVAGETRAGAPRREAFMHFADRSNVDDVRALVAVIVQTERYGTNVTQALRIHAEQFRTRRRQRAEARGERASVKIAFPLVFCLFPAFVLITLGPAIIQFVHVLFGTALE